MNKIISIIITVLLMVNVFGSAFVASAVEPINNQGTFEDSENNTIQENNNIIDSTLVILDETLEGVSLHQVLNKSNYTLNELISIEYELRGSIEEVNTVYTFDGFSVVGDITHSINVDLECQTFSATLSYDGVSENPYFEFKIVTTDETAICAKLFGYSSEYGLFVSKNSFDAAKESSFYYMVECGLLTMDEFNNMLQEEYSKLGVETAYTTNNINLIDPLSHIVSPMQVTPNETTICGSLSWVDDDDISHPMQYNLVEIWDSYRDEKIGAVYTDIYGDYSFSYSATYLTRNIYIKVFARGVNATVQTETGYIYSYTSSVQQMVSQGSVVTIDWEIDMTSDLGRAFQISQAVNVATEYVHEMNGTYIAPITVKYPHTIEDMECFYRPSEDTIYICGEPTGAKIHEPYASWDVIMHEYGHHVQQELGITNSPGGCHTVSENLAVKRNSKDIGIRLAWGESYASVFGGMAQAYFASSLQNIDTVGDAAYEAYNMVWLHYESTYVRQGEACEASIIGVLWDLYDSVSEPHDTISFSHQDYWDMITESEATTMSEFCNYFVNRYNMSHDFALGKLLSYYKMSVSNFTVSISDAVPTFSWTANGTTSELQNNRFILLIFDAYNNEIVREEITTTSYTLSVAQRNALFDGSGINFRAVIIAYQLSSPSTGGYYSEVVNFSKPADHQHQHVYDSCVYVNKLSHRGVCSCGELGDLGAHYIDESYSGGNSAPCAGCGYILDLGNGNIGGIMSITQVSVNGSYILPNGIVVLVDADVEAYLAGTLQFYHPEDVPVTQ